MGFPETCLDRMLVPLRLPFLPFYYRPFTIEYHLTDLLFKRKFPDRAMTLY